MAESEEELKSLLMKVKEESEKVGLKLEDHGIWSHHFIGNRWETVADLIFGGSKIIANGDCSHEIKRCLLLGRKVMTNLHSIFKSRDITLPTKVRLVKAMGWEEVVFDRKRQHIEKQRYYFAKKGPSSQGYDFSSGHVWM